MNLIDVLKIVSKDELTRSMVIVEDCGDVDEAYEELCVAYDPENSKADVISIINESKNELADKMLELLDKNPAQLFIMMRAEGTTFTEYFIEKCGGANAFLEMYEPDKLLADLHNDEESTFDSILKEAQSVNQASSSDTFTPKADVVALSGDNKELVEQLSKLTKLTTLVDTFNNMSNTLDRANANLTEAFTRLCNKEESISARFGCMKNVLNPDGTFRGFTKSNIKEITESIKSLDSEINLGDLAEDEVLTLDEVKKATEYVEDFDPYIFKQFVLSIFHSAETTADCVYVSGLMNRFFDYVKENV